MNTECPHITKQVSSILEIKKTDRSNACENCKHAGPNLWICMQRNCLRVGCSEQANDHSTQHFKLNNSHCVHMNLSSQRMWCYLCEKEVFFGNDRTCLTKNPFDLTAIVNCGNSYPQDGDNRIDGRCVQGLVGLQNIANTCYMNSALQALSNIQPLTYYFIDCADLVEHTVELAAHRNKSGLAKSYLRLIREIWCTRSETKDYIAPRGILYGIRSVHPMFRGFQQHDTQEFLRCFMDQLHEELKETIPNMPREGYENKMNHRSLYKNGVERQRISDKNDVEQSLNSQSDSASHSEAEYETCDSGVSEQSSIYDDSFVKERLSGGANVNMHQIYRERANISRCQKKSNEVNATTTYTSHRSIISDVFDGKLLSSVQCLTCDRISTREETFQDLSLPIPNKDYLNVLHKTHSVHCINPLGYGVRTGASIGSELVKSDGWLSWAWNVFRSWLWGPSITLHDCMASFFSADELKGDNMYSCEKCNKLRTGVKFSRILNLPEALCIHLKRFRHDLSYSSKISSYINFPMECFDMRPYLHNECKSKVSLYNLVSVICHYGTVGGGHYTCFARNEFTSKWYEFDDQHVTEVSVETVQNCQAYVLFYRKHNPSIDLIRVEARDISGSNPSHGSDIRFFVAREWINRFNTFAEPGPINNWAILCPHGALPPNKIELMHKIAVPISQQLWDYIYKKFGGGPAINMLFECQVCKRAADILVRRQNYELAIFTKYNDLDNSNAIFAISMHWLRKWQLFARGLTNKEPGPITNSSISAFIDDCLTPPFRNVKSGSDYAQINEPLWKFLHGIYGGGPEILLRENLNGEITIHDEDDYESNSEIEKTHLESSSNVEPSPSETLQLCATDHLNKSTKLRKSGFEVVNCESDPKLQFTNSYTSIKKDLKQTKHFTVINKKSNIIYDHSASKKRTKRRRNALKNAGFFGPNGIYNSKNSDNSKDSVVKLKFQEDLTFNAFEKKTNLSFQSEKNGATDLKINELGCNVELPRGAAADKIFNKGNHRSFRKKNKLKGKNEYTIINHELQDMDNESSETEV